MFDLQCFSNKAMKKAEEQLYDIDLSSNGEELRVTLSKIKELQNYAQQVANHILRNAKDASDMAYVLDCCSTNTYLRDDEGNRYIKLENDQWGLISGDGIDDTYYADELVRLPSILVIKGSGIRVGQ